MLNKKEALSQALPEVFATSSHEDIGQPLQTSSIPGLKFIVQTGFYNHPGFIKFRDMLLYRSNKYSTSSKVSDTPLQKTDGAKGKTKCPVQAFKAKLEKTIGADKVEGSVVYNLLDLQTPQSVQSMLACAALAQEKYLLTNVVPADQLQELLLEKRFLQDLSESHDSLVIGSPENVFKVKAAVGGANLRFLELAGK
jgi:hypothetical protein